MAGVSPGAGGCAARWVCGALAVAAAHRCDSWRVRARGGFAAAALAQAAEAGEYGIRAAGGGNLLDEGRAVLWGQADEAGERPESAVAAPRYRHHSRSAVDSGVSLRRDVSGGERASGSGTSGACGAIA